MIAPPGDDRLFILGAGRAGRGLARAFLSAGVPLAGLHGRHAEPSSGAEPAVSAGPIPAALREATVVLVAVRDAQLDDALRELLRASLAPGAVVLHASGATEPAALAEVRASGRAAGTFHPLLPLADAAAAPALLEGGWIGVDGDEAAQRAARRLAARLGAHTLVIPAGEKARYHAAAVFASNFPTVLAAVASRLMREAGVDAADGWAAVRSLLAAAAGNVQGAAPSDALTGPIARGDAETVRRHVTALASDPAALEAYLVLSRTALDLARERGVSPAALDAISRALG